MRFAATHKLTSYLMVLSALLAIGLPGALPPVAAALALAGVIGSYFWEPPRIRFERWTTLWNVATVACFLLVVADIARAGTPLEDGVYFLLFLLVNKLFNRRSSRDYQQAYVLSFLLLVAGSALDASVFYVVGFALYVVFATWSLILFNLRRDMEENYLFKHSGDEQSERVEINRILNSRRVVGVAFLAGTGLMSLGVLAGATVFFLAFPRVGFGLIGPHGPHGVSMAGFGAEVRLDQSGLIEPNPTVVARVAFPDGTNGVDLDTLHLRGVAYDVYSNGTWSHGPDYPSTLVFDRTALVWASTDSQHPPAPTHVDPYPGALVQDVQLEPMDTSTVFGASRILGIRLDSNGGADSPTPQGGKEGEVQINHSSTLRYRVYSDLAMPTAAELRTDAPPDPSDLGRYLELPGDLPTTIRALGQRLTADQVTEYDKVMAVERYLGSGFGYSLDIQPTPGVNDPLDDFLFHRKTGHCEFFATAMAILLRAGGVPTRNVDGFLGGEWNKYGNYLAVREGDAHSWVEVYFPGYGWLTFDPTPPGPPLIASTGVLATLRQLFDDFEYAFDNFVLRYDLDKQFKLFHAMLDALRGSGRALQLPSLGALGRGRFRWVWITLAALLAAAVVVVGYRFRRRLAAWARRLFGQGSPGSVGVGRTQAEDHPLRRLLTEAQKRLARRGHPRAPQLTPREYARLLATASVPGAGDVAELVELYYAATFGGEVVPPERMRDLRHRIRRVGDPARTSLAATA
jgi:transglutaminase-like putative cysteine protease